MRKLELSTLLNQPREEIWKIFSDVGNYPRYIKHCYTARLLGPFKEGSTWYDWSTVVYLPLKVTHKIIKVDPQRELIYKIDLIDGGEIWQYVTLEEVNGKTKVNLMITIDFKNKLVDNLIGPIVYSRNKNMLQATIDNFSRR